MSATATSSGGRRRSDCWRPYDADVIVYGHTHRPLLLRDRGRVVVNPGAAGPRRFNLTPGIAKLVVQDRFAHVELIALS